MSWCPERHGTKTAVLFSTPACTTRSKGPATRNDFVNDIVDDARADAIFATLKTIVDDGSSTISSTISLRVAGPLDRTHDVQSHERS